MRRQVGGPTKENASQVGTQKRSDQILAEQVGESRNQVQRYIRLTELIPELLDLVDGKKMAFGVGVELSYLRETEQAELLNCITKHASIPSLTQAQQLKKHSQDGKLSIDVIDAIMLTEKKIIKDVKLTGDRLKKYFPDSYTSKQMENVIVKLLEAWRKQRS